MGTKIFGTALVAMLAVLFLVANAVSQTLVDALVPVVVNVGATVKIDPPSGNSGTGTSGTVTANSEKTFTIKLAAEATPSSSSKGSSSSSGDEEGGEGGEASYIQPVRVNAGAWFSFSRGNVALNLPQTYQNAVISLHSINGKRVLSGNLSASRGFNLSSSNIPAGVYLLSVKGKGQFLSTKLTLSGGNLNISAAFAGEDNSSLGPQLLRAGDYGEWTITVTASGYATQTRKFSPDTGTNPRETFTLSQPPAARDYTDSAKGTFTEKFKMVYVEGGTFTMGCEQNSNCPSGTTPTSQVTLHNYFIGETEVTVNLWRAVMGGSQSSSTGNRPHSTFTWYDAQAFACKLGNMTGKKYRLATEAEWEYAGKGGKNGIKDKFIYAGSNTMSEVAVTGSGPSNVKSKKANQLGIYDMSGNVDEWVYDSWLAEPTSAAKTNPIGPGGQIHTQKTRRGGSYMETDPTRQVAARRIRSIDGADGSIGLRIVYSETLPSGMLSPCDIHAPETHGEPTNSYRDPRWVTGDSYEWRGGGDYTSGSIGEATFKLWDDGTAYAKVGFMGTAVQGQWYTVNNIALVIVPNSGSRYRWPYIFMADAPGEELISVISDKGFNGFIGRLKKVAATSTINKPNITNRQEPKALAAANSPADVMINMQNIPASAQQKDSRLLDGTDNGWFQDNTSMQGTHHYRKDVDSDVFRFAVILPQQGMTNLLAIGEWFTVGNTFLRVKASNGYTTDYLYTVTSDSEFHHVSFQSYERGDFRMFKKMNNSEIFVRTSDLPKTGTPVYSDTDGKSTFVPAPCPSTGCN